MHLFQNNKTKLMALKEKPFKLEKDLQKVVEVNLKQLFGYTLIKSEFTLKKSRIDTLAFDEEARSFVFIEYKRGQNYSVVDQGFSYLSLMLEYKANCIVEYNESQKGNLKRSDVDWSQSRVVFVSPAFTDFQRQSANFRDLPIELVEIKQFENGILSVSPLIKSATAPSIKEAQGKAPERIENVVREIKVYTELDHIQRKSEAVRDLYETFRETILEMDPDIEIVPKKKYIAFKKTGNVVDIHVMQKGLKIWINLPKGKLKDPQQLTEDVSSKGHWGNGDYQLTVENLRHFEYIISLIKQAL